MRFLLLALAVPILAQQYDVVLNNGRVIDPESKLDATRSIGIKDEKIADISATPLTGKTSLTHTAWLFRRDSSICIHTDRHLKITPKAHVATSREARR